MNNRDGQEVSLQVSNIGNIPAGDFNPGRVFLIKNITDNNLRVTIKPAGTGKEIETILYPGWNAELVTAVIGATESQLQYGW